MAKGHLYGVALILAGFLISALFVTFSIGPIKGYLMGSIGLIILAVGLTLIMNEEDVDKKWIGYMWLAILAIIGLLLGINYYGISLTKP